jgi:hypothetical protein
MKKNLLLESMYGMDAEPSGLLDQGSLLYGIDNKTIS